MLTAPTPGRLSDGQPNGASTFERADIADMRIHEVCVCVPTYVHLPAHLLPKHYFLSTTKGKIGRSYAQYPLVGVASVADDCTHAMRFSCDSAHAR